MLASRLFLRQAGSRRWGFTLLELLLVVAILGIAIAAVMPRLGGLLEGGQVAVAARAVAQAGRYARSMALLHQMPLDLVLQTDGAEIRVEAASAAESSPGRSTEGLWVPDAVAPERPEEPAAAGSVPFGRALSKTERQNALAGLGLRSAATGTPGAAELPPEEEDAGGLREELALRRVLEGVRLVFLGYLDRVDGIGSGTDAQEGGVARVRYRANGTCRPYRVVLMGLRTEERFEVSVDAVGTPRLAHGDGARGHRP